MYHIIINPASRSGRGAKIWAEQVEPALKAGNTEYQTYFSGKAGEVRQLAAQITAEHAAEPDLTLIVLGGGRHNKRDPSGHCRSFQSHPRLHSHRLQQ